MRIMLLLAVGLSSAAIGTAAAGRPGGAGFGHGASPAGTWSYGGGHHGGHGASPAGTWSYGGRHHPGKGGSAHFGPGFGRDDGRHDRFERSGRDDFVAYGGVGIEWPVGVPDQHGSGFFAGGGGQTRLEGGRPHYDYDRGYPYQWASAAVGARRAGIEEERAVEPRARCTVESGVRVCRSW